jgi:hypothetical protein
MVVVTAGVEGLVDEAVIRRLAGHAGIEVGPVHGKSGKAHLRQRIAGYNNAARIGPWVVLVDLNREAECAPPLRDAWLRQPAPMMCFRVAVRGVESWLLADRGRLARFLRVPISRIPTAPDSIEDPKRAVIELAARSRRRDIQEDMVPRPGSGRTVGPAYASRLIEFVGTHWNPEVAAGSSDSLRRCLARLKEMGRGHP